jgi:hypothetical protein
MWLVIILMEQIVLCLMELLYTDIYNAAQQDAKQKHYFIFPLMDMWVPHIHLMPSVPNQVANYLKGTGF